MVKKTADLNVEEKKCEVINNENIPRVTLSGIAMRSVSDKTHSSSCRRLYIVRCFSLTPSCVCVKYIRETIAKNKFHGLATRRLSPDGLFLLENGIELFLWVGREANPAVLSALFGTSSLQGVDLTTLRLQVTSREETDGCCVCRCVCVGVGACVCVWCSVLRQARRCARLLFGRRAAIVSYVSP